MYDPVVIQMLEKNVRDLQQQLRTAYVRIKQLNDENYKLRRELGVKKDNGKSVTNNSDGEPTAGVSTTNFTGEFNRTP